MASEQGFSFITVNANDEEEIVIHTGASAKRAASVEAPVSEYVECIDEEDDGLESGQSDYNYDEADYSEDDYIGVDEEFEDDDYEEDDSELEAELDSTAAAAGSAAVSPAAAGSAAVASAAVDSSASQGVSRAAAQGASRPAVSHGAAPREPKYRTTTQEDLDSIEPMSNVQKAVLAFVALVLVGFLVYWFALR